MCRQLDYRVGFFYLIIKLLRLNSVDQVLKLSCRVPTVRELHLVNLYQFITV